MPTTITSQQYTLPPTPPQSYPMSNALLPERGTHATRREHDLRDLVPAREALRRAQEGSEYFRASWQHGYVNNPKLSPPDRGTNAYHSASMKYPSVTSGLSAHRFAPYLPPARSHLASAASKPFSRTTRIPYYDDPPAIQLSSPPDGDAITMPAASTEPRLPKAYDEKAHAPLASQTCSSGSSRHATEPPKSSAARISLECTVCGVGATGPWKRGPLGPYSLCSACGGIPWESEDNPTPTNAIEALALLDNMRFTRLADLDTKTEGSHRTALLERLQSGLPDTTYQRAQTFFSSRQHQHPREASAAQAPSVQTKKAEERATVAPRASAGSISAAEQERRRAVKMEELQRKRADALRALKLERLKRDALATQKEAQAAAAQTSQAVQLVLRNRKRQAAASPATRAAPATSTLLPQPIKQASPPVPGPNHQAANIDQASAVQTCASSVGPLSSRAHPIGSYAHPAVRDGHTDAPQKVSYSETASSGKDADMSKALTPRSLTTEQKHSSAARDSDGDNKNPGSASSDSEQSSDRPYSSCGSESSPSVKRRTAPRSFPFRESVANDDGNQKTGRIIDRRRARNEELRKKWFAHQEAKKKRLQSGSQQPASAGSHNVDRTSKLSNEAIHEKVKVKKEETSSESGSSAGPENATGTKAEPEEGEVIDDAEDDAMHS